MANTKIEVILEMPFLKISNADISFGKKILTWRIYTTNEALPIIKQVQIVNSKEFVIMPLDVNSEMFVVHVAIREQKEMPVHSKREA